MAIRNAVFWDVTLCGSFKNRLFGGISRLHFMVTRIAELGIVRININRSTLWRNTNSAALRLLVIANIFPTAPNLVTLMMEAMHLSETSFLTRATRRNITEDGILLNIKLMTLLCRKFYLCFGTTVFM
jgi:hypothetical protein